MASTTTQLAPYAVEEQTLEIVRELMRELGSRHAAESVALHSSFDRDLGLGSLERVELLVRCEARFGIQLPDEIAQEGEAPADWVRAILRGGAAVEAAPRYRIVPPTRQAPPEPHTAATLVEVLRRQAEIEPDRVHIHLLEEDSGQDITYGKLLTAAGEVATGLRAHGLERDDTVAIMLPTGADFFFGFFGVSLAGGIPAPIYPPARPDKIEEYVRRQILILRNAGVRFLITFDRVKAVSQLMKLNLPSLIEATSVEALRQAAAGAPMRAVTPSETGFIQYTSGSTGDPKGVVLSHANILANVRAIGRAVEVRPTDVVVTWLPLYHDMGLIGSWLFSLYYAAPITVLSPLAFLSRPERWLWALHDARGTLCPAPNFSFELCARKIPDRALQGLDLSAWRVAINAGEAVLPETVERFARRFAPFGFRAESMLPCYGLAESSVALCIPPIDRQPVIDTVRRETLEREGRAEPPSPGENNVARFVSAGPPLWKHEVRIVDDAGQPVPERTQGRVLFRGPSMTSGYFRNPQATAASMTADGWMDSGDLGYLAGGEIYITGRLKDCIIKGGRNIIPQEVEAAASEAAGVRRGCVAAFGAGDASMGTERLVVVAETRATREDDLRRIEAEIIRHVEALVGLPPDQVQLVGPQSVPKTSSGKIRRSETRSLFLSGALQARRRPPWLQILRLWVENGGSWAGSFLRRGVEALRRIYVNAVLWAACAAAGLLGRRAAGGVLRAFLRLTGVRVEVEGIGRIATGQPAVLVANHVGRADPLVVAAAVRTPVLFADSSALSKLPGSAASLLDSLVVAPVPGETAPPGGLLRQRIRRALEQGHAVLVFPEGRIGDPAHLHRYRLDAFHAAVETGAPVYPIAIAGTAPMLAPAGHPPLRVTAKIIIGEPIRAAANNHREIVRLRDRVREALCSFGC